eukprot:280913-Chlamydomonas_euryale.AAC.3
MPWRGYAGVRGRRGDPSSRLGASEWTEASALDAWRLRGSTQGTLDYGRAFSRATRLRLPQRPRAARLGARAVSDAAAPEAPSAAGGAVVAARAGTLAWTLRRLSERANRFWEARAALTLERAARSDSEGGEGGA